jgi:hypothetical protein
MSEKRDDDWYKPNRPPAARRAPKPGELAIAWAQEERMAIERDVTGDGW